MPSIGTTTVAYRVKNETAQFLKDTAEQNNLRVAQIINGIAGYEKLPISVVDDIVLRLSNYDRM